MTIHTEMPSPRASVFRDGRWVWADTSEPITPPGTPHIGANITLRCCEIGTYDCQVPMPLSGRVQGVDVCVSDIVAALNAANITTVWSCCGHGIADGRIGLSDGRILAIGNMAALTEEKAS